MSQTRYIDDIFMTTNQSVEEMSTLLERMQRKDINIKITGTLDTCVHFLDVTIMNQAGHLRTTIFHKPTTEPYILPFTSDHPTHVCRNIPYAALLRAARICSHVEDFSIECTRIDMSLLLNEYPPNFIHKQFSRFFKVNENFIEVSQFNQHVYQRVHDILLNQPTRREKHLTKMIQDPIRNPTVLQPKIWNSSLLFPRYTFDSSLSQHFPTHFHTWWTTHYAFRGSPIENVAIQIVANTNHTLEQHLIRKKPDKTLLTKLQTQKC